MTRREMLIFYLIAVAMIASGLTLLFGPWALAGTGAATLITVLFTDEVEEDKPDA
jgi:hypothetical protein